MKFNILIGLQEMNGCRESAAGGVNFRFDLQTFLANELGVFAAVTAAGDN